MEGKGSESYKKAAAAVGRSGGGGSHWLSKSCRSFARFSANRPISPTSCNRRVSGPRRFLTTSSRYCFAVGRGLTGGAEGLSAGTASAGGGLCPTYICGEWRERTEPRQAPAAAQANNRPTARPYGLVYFLESDFFRAGAATGTRATIICDECSFNEGPFATSGGPDGAA